MKKLIVSAIEFITLGRVRGQHKAYGQPSLRWWYIGNAAERFKHGGWVCLSMAWFKMYGSDPTEA